MKKSRTATKYIDGSFLQGGPEEGGSLYGAPKGSPMGHLIFDFLYFIKLQARIESKITQKKNAHPPPC